MRRSDGEDYCLDDLQRLRLPPSMTQLEGRQFLMADSGPGLDRVLLFATHETLDSMRGDTDLWMSDGCFKEAPKPFVQLYTIHIQVRHIGHPVAYALLPNKERPTYDKMWQLLRGLLGDESTWKKPSVMLMDFELGAWKAFESTFPGIEVQGCFFHFRQAINYRLREMGLGACYAKAHAFRKRVATLAAMAFVPVAMVPEVWDRQKGIMHARFNELRRLGGILPDIQRAMEDEEALWDYFERTWVGPKKRRGGRAKPNFAVDMWSCEQRIRAHLALTNNRSERYFRANSLKHCRSSLTIMVAELSKQQLVAEAIAKDIQQGASGNPWPPTVARDERLRVVMAEWEARIATGELLADEFLDLVADILLHDTN